MGKRNPVYDKVLEEFLSSGKKSARVEIPSLSFKAMTFSLRERCKGMPIKVHTLQKQLWLERIEEEPKKKSR